MPATMPVKNSVQHSPDAITAIASRWYCPPNRENAPKEKDNQTVAARPVNNHSATRHFVLSDRVSKKAACQNAPFKAPKGSASPAINNRMIKVLVCGLSHKPIAHSINSATADATGYRLSFVFRPFANGSGSRCGRESKLAR